MGAPYSISSEEISLIDVIKATRGTTEFTVRFNDINNLLSDTIEPLFSNLQGDPNSNAQLKAIFSSILNLINLQNAQLTLTNQTLSDLIFELIEQGFEFESELINNQINVYKPC